MDWDVKISNSIIKGATCGGGIAVQVCQFHVG